MSAPQEVTVAPRASWMGVIFTRLPGGAVHVEIFAEGVFTETGLTATTRRELAALLLEGCPEV